MESNLNQMEETQKTITSRSDQLEILVNGFNQSLETTKSQMVSLSENQ